MPVPNALEIASLAANRREKRPGIFVRQAVGDFVRVQKAVEKPLAKPLVRRLHPSDLDDVNARAQNHGIYDLRFAIDAQANSKQCFNTRDNFSSSAAFPCRPFPARRPPRGSEMERGSVSRSTTVWF
jgi:hypothetical protein